MANVKNVQIYLENASLKYIDKWEVGASYSDHFNITCYAVDINKEQKRSLITFNDGIGNEHQTTITTTVDVGGTSPNKQTSFTAKENMKIVIIYDSVGGINFEFIDS